MTDALRKSFESMLKNGDYAKAETELKNFMTQDPTDRDAKMLYGTCRMLQGDTETAKRIHDELEPFYSNSDDIPKPEKSFWQKYHRWIIYGSVAALVLGSAVYFGKSIKGGLPASTYAGPPIPYYCKECGKPTIIGWGWIKDQKYEDELRAKVKKGLIPCETCGKDTPFSETKPVNSPGGEKNE